MPDTFDGYARVLHPAGGRGGEWRGLTWSEVASQVSKPFHPDVMFQDLVGNDADRHPVLGDIAPLAGSLPLSALRSLVRFLERWVEEDEECWFAMWDGNGTWWKGAHGGDGRYDDERDLVLRSTPRVHGQGRDYFLMQGRLHDVLLLFEASGSQSPALWWPESRAWAVSTDIDAPSSYVGGSGDLIAELLRNEEIEVVPSRLGAPHDHR